MERSPMHIERIISSLEAGVSPEKVLLSATPLLTSDITLLHIYLQLGFSLESNAFLSTPTSAQVLSLLKSEYRPPLKQLNVDSFLSASPVRGPDIDFELRSKFLVAFEKSNLNCLTSKAEIGLEADPQEFHTPNPKKLQQTPSTQAQFTPSPQDSTPFSEQGNPGTPRSNRGLKQLTMLVKHLVCKDQPTSFTNVALSLIAKLIETEGPDRLREERNVRRRVYDAINVLIAAGVLEREGKGVIWREEWDCIEIEEQRKELENRRNAVEEKRRELKHTLDRWLAIQQLMNRNSAARRTSRVEFPFFLLVTEDSPENSMSIKYGASGRTLHVKCRKETWQVMDVEVLFAMKLHKMSPSSLSRYLPSPSLLKYCADHLSDEY